GTKFGKTEKGAVWISADRTSPYTLYQFLINLSDDEARHFALFFSLEDRAAIEAMFARHADKPSSRVIQRHVAREITALLHGQQAASRAVQASEALFAGDVHTIDADMLGEMSDVPAVDLPLNLLDDAGMSATDLLIAVELASSKRDAREHVGNAAVQVNGHKADSTTMVTRDDLLHGSVIFVRRGKREWRLARFE
ncbi:MAG TPA: hypothetical protein VFD73_21725, partial [Gemmatimonadales bacterium]|nr:hypothetical protein [Gemmatimonadales bacterium]